MEHIDLTNRTCAAGHNTLKVISQKNDCFIVQCTTCGETVYEHDLLWREGDNTHEASA